MFTRPLVLCPTDLSEASRGALRYAGVLAEHFYADLVVLAVEDPFLNPTVLDGRPREQLTRAALTKFVDETFVRRPQVATLGEHIVTGRPSEEIRRCAEQFNADLIVMSTHGTTGVRKLVFGSVTERVLRNTRLPVLVTPGADPGPKNFEEWTTLVKRVLVPVDLSAWTPQQVAIAAGVAEALGSELLFAHVMTPDGGRFRADVHHELDGLIRSVKCALHPAMTIASGDPAKEIARLARERDANLIVTGLHSSLDGRQHMGHVTYRLLCEASVPVLAWPPARSKEVLVTKDSRAERARARASSPAVSLRAPDAELVYALAAA